MVEHRRRRVAALSARALDGPGELPGSTRRAVAAGAVPDGPAGAYVAKVRAHAYKVVDGDVDALRGDGWSEDEIFELTVAVALGEGLRRLDQGLAALDANTRPERL